MFELSLDRLTLRTDARVLRLDGPSGSGKTTILRTIAGFRAGRVWVAGRELTLLAPEQRALGWVPQDTTLFPHLDVAANIRFGGSDDVGIVMFDLQPLLPRRVRNLSGGEKQRVALARALAHAPTCLLLDEAFSALDAAAARRYSARLAEHVQARAQHVIFVAHATDPIALIPDAAVTLQ